MYIWNMMECDGSWFKTNVPCTPEELLFGGAVRWCLRVGTTPVPWWRGTTGPAVVMAGAQLTPWWEADISSVGLEGTIFSGGDHRSLSRTSSSITHHWSSFILSFIVVNHSYSLSINQPPLTKIHHLISHHVSIVERLVTIIQPSILIINHHGIIINQLPSIYDHVVVSYHRDPPKMIDSLPYFKKPPCINHHVSTTMYQPPRINHHSPSSTIAAFLFARSSQGNESQRNHGAIMRWLTVRYCTVRKR